MSYPVQIPGFEHVELAVKPAALKPKVLVNGVAAPDGSKRGSFVLTRSDGTPVEGYFRPGFDPVPAVEVDGQRYLAVEPMKWYEHILAAWPLVLILIGGIVGGLVGAVAWRINTGLLRSDRSQGSRYLLTFVVGIAAVVIVGIIAVLIRSSTS